MIGNQERFAQLREDLHVKYGHRVAENVIDEKLDELIASHTANAKVEDFIPIFVQREAEEFFGAARPHVRFAAGDNHALAERAVELTVKHGGSSIEADAVHILEGRKSLAEMPNFLVYLGADVAADGAHAQAAHDVHIWHVDTSGSAIAAEDDLEYRVLYMLGRLGIEPVTGAPVPTQRPANEERAS